MTRAITRKKFKKEVIDNAILAVVQFKTGSNGACQIISPVYAELAARYKEYISFYKVDADKSKALSAEYGITELPSILFFKGGEVIDHVLGLVPKDELIKKIENVLNPTINNHC